MSIASEITRLTLLRDNIRSKLVNLGILPAGSAQTADLEDCYDAIDDVTALNATTYTPSTSSQTIASGNYLKGAQTISGDANLVAGNIKKDVSIFNVTGTYVGSTAKKQVFFIDYDGTELYSYSAAEANNLTELPSNPTHSGLIAQGWNWTLAQIKAQLTAIPDGPVWVGQLYETSSGGTEIDIEIIDYVKTIWLRITLESSRIDWGDGSSPGSYGSSLTAPSYVSHTYSSPGLYTITITPLFSGNKMTFLGQYNTDVLIKYKQSGSTNVSIQNSEVKAVRCGSNCIGFNNMAFLNCKGLEYVTVSQSVQTLGVYCFNSCRSLKSLTLPNGITQIGGTVSGYNSTTFMECEALKNISLPPSTTEISDYAFNGAVNLKSITIPNGVTTLKPYAFNTCSSLEEIYLPSTVSLQSFPAYLFQNCYSLRKVGGSVLATNYCFQNCYSLQDVTISTTYNTGISQYSFENCYSLSEITLPSTVSSIQSYAFRNCHCLKSVTIPYNVSSIGSYAFRECYSLKTATLPNSTAITSLSSNLFYNCYDLISVTIPSSVQSFQYTTFYNCCSLRAIYFRGTTPPTCSSASWYSTLIDITLYVPRGYLSAYTGATNYPSSSSVNYVEWDPT